MTTIGERLKIARQRAGLKQTQVRDRININNKTLSGYENNVSEPDVTTLVTLAELYEVSYKWLLTGKDEENQKRRDDDEFLNFINDPELQVWYKELPKSDEEELRQLKDMWEIIKKHKK